MAATSPIGEFLVRKELISPRALAQVLREQPAKRQRLISMLILRAELEIDDGATVLSEQTGYCAAFERHLERRDTSVAKLLPAALCGQHAVIAIGKTAGGRLIVGARDPSPALAAELERATQLTIELAVVPAILVERLVRATFGLALDGAPSLPTEHQSMPRARSISALYADSQPPRSAAAETVPAPVVRAPTAKVVIPERRSGPIEKLSDLDSAPILLDRPKRPTAPPEPVKPEGERTQPLQALSRAPAAPQPRAQPPGPPPKPRPPTSPPGPPPLPRLSLPSPPSAFAKTEERPAAPRQLSQHDEITRPAVPIDPDLGNEPTIERDSTRHQTPTAPAPNQPVPVDHTAPPFGGAAARGQAPAADARPPARHQAPTRPTPNVQIPDEARKPDAAPAMGSIALADLAVEAGATASDPAVKLAPRPLAERAAERPRSVSEMFGELAEETNVPALPEPPKLAAKPEPARPAPLPRAATEPPPRISAPALPPPPSAMPRPPTEPTAVSAPPRPPPAPGTGSIEAVCKEIERAISRATADRVLITFAGSRFKSALLVMVADGVARGARGQGPRLQAVQTVVLPIEAPSIIQVAHDTRALTRESPASPTQDRIADLLGTTVPLAVPILVEDTVVGVLAVGDAVAPAVSDEDLQKVVLAFATAYKRLYKAK